MPSREYRGRNVITRGQPPSRTPSTHRHIYPFAEKEEVEIPTGVNESKSKEIGSGWEGDSDWEMAPATSHCWGFKFKDYRTASKLDRISMSRPSRDVAGSHERYSIIYVRFKGEDYSWTVAAEYAYLFTDHVLAEKMFKELRESPHPYAQVVRAKFIDGDIPYERIS